MWGRALPYTVGGSSLRVLFRRGLLEKPSPKQGEGVGTMVTYAGLFQFTLVIIGIIGLIVQITKKK